MLLKSTLVNDYAAATAMNVVVGEDARKAIENLYTVIVEAVGTGWTAGYEEGLGAAEDADEEAFKAGYDQRDMETEGGEEVTRAMGFRDGFDAGYKVAEEYAAAAAKAPGTGPQPDVVISEPYEGDSGDESPQIIINGWGAFDKNGRRVDCN